MIVFWQMSAARGSTEMVNKSGESGHPCLVPLCKVKLCEVRPLVVIAADSEVYSNFTHPMKESQKQYRGGRWKTGISS